MSHVSHTHDMSHVSHTHDMSHVSHTHDMSHVSHTHDMSHASRTYAGRAEGDAPAACFRQGQVQMWQMMAAALGARLFVDIFELPLLQAAAQGEALLADSAVAAEVCVCVCVCERLCRSGLPSTRMMAHLSSHTRVRALLASTA